MGLTWIEGTPESETWCVVYGASVREAVEARWLAMLRVALFTLMPQYLHDTSRYSHRLTLVFRGPVLLAFAFLNVELVCVPDLTAWSGVERLSYWALHLGPKAPKRTTRVTHLGAIAVSPHGPKGLGSRLMAFQKGLAHALLPDEPVKILALEAIRPLDTDYYNHFGFQTSTPTFWAVSDPVSLVPMVLKLGASDAIGLPVMPLEEPSVRIGLVPEPGPWASLTTVVRKVSEFLWHLKVDSEASAALLSLCKRLELTETEIHKLWSMRHHSLAYGAKAPRPKSVLDVGPHWFTKPPVAFDAAALHALKHALGGAP